MIFITWLVFQHFKDEDYFYDLSYALFHVYQIFDSTDNSYWFYTKLLRDVTYTHAPVKKRIIKPNQVPYMNSKLRKAINVRNDFRRKSVRCKSSEKCEKYHK